VSRHQKGKASLDLLEQETVSGSGISWAICKSALRPRQLTMPAPHYSVFLQARCPSCRPTSSVKALNAEQKIWLIFGAAEFMCELTKFGWINRAVVDSRLVHIS